MAKSTYVRPKVKNKQRTARASSFHRLAQTFRARATNFRNVAKTDKVRGKLYWQIKAEIMRDIAADLDNEARTLRAMR